ncbi:MAG TPA: hypothetical protein VIT93_07150, partial [Dehalococcoidia bacterium]
MSTGGSPARGAGPGSAASLAGSVVVAASGAIVPVVVVVGGNADIELLVVERNARIDVLVVVDVVEPNIELEDEDDELVDWHCAAQSSSMVSPTAFLSMRRASADVTRQLPSASHTAGAHATIDTAARSANRASLDTGREPELTGWPQSPCAAMAAADSA